MTKPHFPAARRRLPLRTGCLAALASALLASAQAQSPAATATSQTVVITGNPLGSERVAAPVSVLAGDALVLRRGTTLGDTLDGLPGVAATWFGPNANRPVVRGLEGDRVRVLANAGASLDASALSFDHALPVDPLILTRIEVQRGPAALLYGGSAIGGVVNAIDNRIPEDRLNALAGAAELRAGGAARERAGAAWIEGGQGALAWHVDAFARDSGDLRVPLHTPLEDGAQLPSARHVRNSAARTLGGAAGGTLFVAGGRIGLSLDTYDSHYGVVAEPDVTIDMKRDRLALAGEFKGAGPFDTLRVHANAADYRHQEVKGDGTVGTVFSGRGRDLRVEAGHAPLGALAGARGVVGLQLEDSDFSALGEEAFVPGTRTRKAGLFALEEWPTRAGGALAAGLRFERARVESEGDRDPATPRFGTPAGRSFALTSASLSHWMPLAGPWSLSLAASASERAPTYFELFADGVHAATGAYERGDPALGKERGSHAELALQRQAGPDRWGIGVFATRFARFISLQATGDEVNGGGAVVPAGTPDAVPLYVFKPVRARLLGVEIVGRQRLAGGNAGWSLDGTLKLDAVRGEDVDTRQPLPRIAPLRARLGLEFAGGRWNGRVELDHARRQDRVPDGDAATAGYTLLHLSLARRFDLGGSDALWFVRAGNLGDRLAYSASAVQTIRGLSPLPGRSVATGLRVSF